MTIMRGSRNFCQGGGGCPGPTARKQLRQVSFNFFFSPKLISQFLVVSFLGGGGVQHFSGGVQLFSEGGGEGGLNADLYRNT